MRYTHSRMGSRTHKDIQMNRPIYPTSAMFPGLTLSQIIDALQILKEEYHTLNLERLQICPQSFGTIDDNTVQFLRNTYPNIQFQLHSNVRITLGKKPVHANHRHPEALNYLKEFNRLTKSFGATVYSLHAGLRSQSSLEDMYQNLRELNRRFEVTIAVEGMYPDRKNQYLLNSWQEYESLLSAGVPYAIDLSHLNIVSTYERHQNLPLTKSLLSNPWCMEIHMSSNSGKADSHLPIRHLQQEWWYPALDHTNLHALIFAEENHTAWLKTTYTNRQRIGQRVHT